MAASKGARHSSSNLHGVRVLVVEDGWQLADALRLTFEQQGMAVDGPVATAREAQRLASQCRPDLAVVDLNLRGEMAYPFLDWLHERGVRVIVTSGYEDLPLSLSKFAAVLRKPFTVETLLATLQQVVKEAPAR